jgi:predicted HAD superfamily phosphohydrolase
MGSAGQSVIEAFDHLPTPERVEVLRMLLSRSAADATPADDELVAAADEIFLRLDQQESQG